MLSTFRSCILSTLSLRYELPFLDESFDAVFSHSLLEHIGDPCRTIYEFRSVLRLGAAWGSAARTGRASYSPSPPRECRRPSLDTKNSPSPTPVIHMSDSTLPSNWRTPANRGTPSRSGNERTHRAACSTKRVSCVRAKGRDLPTRLRKPRMQARAERNAQCPSLSPICLRPVGD